MSTSTSAMASTAACSSVKPSRISSMWAGSASGAAAAAAARAAGIARRVADRWSGVGLHAALVALRRHAASTGVLEWLRAQRTRRALGLALGQWVRVGSTLAIADRARGYVARLWIHHRLAVGWRAWRELVERPRHARIHEVVAEWRTSAPVKASLSLAAHAVAAVGSPVPDERTNPTAPPPRYELLRAWVRWLEYAGEAPPKEVVVSLAEAVEAADDDDEEEDEEAVENFRWRLAATIRWTEGEKLDDVTKGLARKLRWWAGGGVGRAFRAWAGAA